MNTVIPFSGFYNSYLDAEIDRGLDMCVSDQNGNVREALADLLRDKVDWQAVFKECASDYAEWFAKEFSIALTFDSLYQPREYNFETDRIFCTIEESEVSRLLAATPRDILDRVAAERHTSRSGFHSYYSPGVDDWGDVATWEAEQVHTLVKAYAMHHHDLTGDDDDGEFDSLSEKLDYQFIEWMSGDGAFEELVQKHAKGAERVWKIADYLNIREAREESNA